MAVRRRSNSHARGRDWVCPIQGGEPWHLTMVSATTTCSTAIKFTNERRDVRKGWRTCQSEGKVGDVREEDEDDRVGRQEDRPFAVVCQDGSCARMVPTPYRLGYQVMPRRWIYRSGKSAQSTYTTKRKEVDDQATKP